MNSLDPEVLQALSEDEQSCGDDHYLLPLLSIL